MRTNMEKEISTLLSNLNKEYCNKNYNSHDLIPIIDEKICHFLTESQNYFFSKQNLARLTYSSRDQINRVINYFPEEIVFKNNRSTISCRIATYFFLTPFVISQIMKIDFSEALTIVKLQKNLL